jgi:hypothetical protein
MRESARPGRWGRLLLVLLFALTASCRQKSYTPFYDLEGRQARLVMHGDDGYVSDELDPILAGLDAVPEGCPEKPRAVALSAELKAGRARVVAERAPKPPQPAATRPPWGGGGGRPGIVTPAACVAACRAVLDPCLTRQGCIVSGQTVTCPDVFKAETACATEMKCEANCRH